MATADERGEEGPEEDPTDGDEPASGDEPTGGDHPDAAESADPTALAELAYVGPATADVLATEGVTVAEIREKTVSYRDLVVAGVNPGVAGKLRREHSLHWTIDEGGADLDRRSKHVRGLRDGEREWVASTEWAREGGEDEDETRTGEATARSDDEAAAEREWVSASTAGGSGTGSGSPTETDATGDAFAAEAAWRERASSPPVTALSAIGRAEADRLEAVGVDTVRRLATADPSYLATRLGIPVDRVREWCAAARDRAD